MKRLNSLNLNLNLNLTIYGVSETVKIRLFFETGVYWGEEKISYQPNICVGVRTDSCGRTNKLLANFVRSTSAMSAPLPHEPYRSLLSRKREHRRASGAAVLFDLSVD